MSKKWPWYLTKKPAHPHISAILFVGGILIFFNILVWVFEFLIDLPKGWGIGIALALTVSITLFVAGGLELIAWIGESRDKEEETSP